jgi:hypothetical protein
MVEHAEWVVKDFSVQPGDPIGAAVQGYFMPGGIARPEQLTIDFSTGCTVVAVDMALRISDAPAITLTAAGAPSSSRLIKDSLVLYYIDASGALRTRWQEPDLVLAEEMAAPAATAATAPTAGATPGTAPARTGRQLTPGELRVLARQREQSDEAARAAAEQGIKAQTERDRSHPQGLEAPGPGGGF